MYILYRIPIKYTKIAGGTVVRRFFSQHFCPDQLLLKRHMRRIPLLSHWHVHLHADSTGDAKDGRCGRFYNMSKAMCHGHVYNAG